ncbi:MAG: response regulator [Planctomycetota bacterium]|nr:MAG: response regulator [Planctomycetota bacterium]
MAEAAGGGPRRLLREAAAFIGEPPDLGDLADLLDEAIPDIVAAFYDRIRRHERAWAFIDSKERFQRLHLSLAAWLDRFLRLRPDTAERAELAVRMAEAHLVIGMPLELTLLGHQLLRRLVRSEVGRRWPEDGGREALVDAFDRLQRAFAWDELLLVATYHSVSIAREQATAARMAELNQQLQESLRAQENLVRTTSHELRTPLTGLLGLLNLMRRGVYAGEAERRRAEEDVYGAARHLLALVDDLLHLSRLELGKAGFQPREIAVLRESEDVLRRFRPRFEDLGLELRSVGDPDLQAWADPQRFAQVLSNLLQNALNHTFQGGVRVELEAMPGGGHILIRVVDTGTGIEPELVDRLFDPFAQGAEGGNGLGLGLAICRRLVLRMGGRIRARSAGIGHGSSFEFTLPAAGRRRPAAEHFGPADRPLRILLVDDDAVWRNDLASWLAAELPVRVTALGDADDALRRASSEPFQLLLLDLAFPAEEGARAFDGLELLQALALSPATMLTPKWMISGHGRDFLGPELSRGWHDRFWEKGEILADRPAFLAAVAAQLGLDPATDS